MASSLPLEIWFAIVDYLPRNDQLRVSQVSAQFCAVARRIVYRNVNLRSDDSAVDATLVLLARDHSLSRSVKRLHIYTTARTERGPTWFDPSVLAGMTNLCGLNLTGMPFHTAEDQHNFNSTVSKSLPTLKKLKYRSLQSEDSDGHKPNPKTHVPVLQISGLQEITWNDVDTFVHPSPIFSPIHASRETLTHIRIPRPTSYSASYEPLARLFTLRFPCLSTLHLGEWRTITSVGATLTRFLIAHPLIEDLHLSISDLYMNGIYCHVAPDDALGPGTLPNLRRLTVDTFNLAIFLRSGVSSLQTLESLRTGITYVKEEEEEDVAFVEMFRALKAYGGLLGLKALELELEPGYYGEVPRNARWVVGFGELCPNVERFRGNCEAGCTAMSHFAAVWRCSCAYDIVQVTNRNIFASYCNLKSQVMPSEGLHDLSKQDRMNYVNDLAARNPSVTELLFYSPDDDDVIIFQFRVVRDAEGGITTIVEVLANGDYLVLDSRTDLPPIYSSK